MAREKKLANQSSAKESECHDLDRHIPCHLFHQNQAVPAFGVGPVKFLPRAECLDSFIKNPDVRDLI